ncbi:hypothetical protein ACFL4S_01180, partial [bacterium]
MNRTLAVISAMTWEINPVKNAVLKLGWNKTRCLLPGKDKLKHVDVFVKDNNNIIFYSTGVGKNRAQKNIKRFFDNFNLSDILFAGFAGALTEGLDAGSVLWPQLIYNDGTKEKYICNKERLKHKSMRFLKRAVKQYPDEDKDGDSCCKSADKTILVTSDELKDKKGKQILQRDFPDAVIVDMESFYIAQAAAGMGLSLNICKSVSDAFL